MAETMVDSNVLLDVLTEDPAWFEWSSRSLEECAEDHILVINPIIYAEISISFNRLEDLDAAVPESMVERRPIPLEAAFLAGKCFLKYRERGGRKQSILPDFFIGAHAAVERMGLLTRDASRYRTYFPKLKLICPE
ncbi:MAG: type II toxin-antitoxin system VapC family toxin [Planctomycetota bacterium]|nr:type II toxin-antitoxin system VapC family toxin [Planctomycetota bacterium]